MKKQNRNILAITDKLLGLHLTLNVAENNRFYSTSGKSGGKVLAKKEVLDKNGGENNKISPTNLSKNKINRIKL